MKKILLIEDDKTMRENTAELLELAGFEVVVAENGKLGVEKARKEKPNLIICDIMMPELDGYGVLNSLMRLPKTASIPFIFLTAKADKEDFRKGMEIGADDYITKPFTENELLGAIDIRLKKHQSYQDLAGNDGRDLQGFIQGAEKTIGLSNIVKELKEFKLKKKQVLFSAGDTPDCVFYLIEGKLKVFKSHADGKEYIVEVLEKDDYLGVIQILNEVKYNSQCVALEDSTLVKIPKDDFLNLILKNRDVSTQFIKLLANNVEAKEEQLLSFAYDTVRLRVAKALLELKKNSGSDLIKITREDLASLAGTTTETVIRSLSDFKKDGIIESEGRQIKIIDAKSLEKQDY